MRETMIAITIELPDDLLGWVDEQAAANQQSRNSYIYELIAVHHDLEIWRQAHEPQNDWSPEEREIIEAAVHHDLEVWRQAHEPDTEAEWKAIYAEINDDEVAMSEAWLANSAAQDLEPYDWTAEESDPRFT